jgi:hypothetical protein
MGARAANGASPLALQGAPSTRARGVRAVDKVRGGGYESGVRAPILRSGRSEGRAKVARRLGGRSIAGMGALLGALAAAQGCSGSEFCSANSYECGDPNGGKAGSAGTAGTSSGGKAGTGGAGKGGNTSGGASGSAGSAGGSVGGAAGDGGEAGVGADAGSGGEGGSVHPPPACDPAALEDGCQPTTGIFVSTTGDDDDDGTATAPLATIGAAVTLAASTGAPIFVCGGTYTEHLVITDDNLEIHGGFACPQGGNPWLYDSTMRARIAPSTAGYALEVTDVSGLDVTDLEFESVDADVPGASSIAVFVSTSTDVAFTRVGITAGNGADGDDGVREGSNHFAGVLTGNEAVGDAGGAAITCTCGDDTTSIGGLGGTGGPTPLGGGTGVPDQGAGQGGTVGPCNTVGTGANGGNATAFTDGEGAMSLGTLATSGWTPAAGAPGLNGPRGQGGGGGAGASTGGGGGGGCGGCGGAGGGAGKGGGASIGLSAVESEISVNAVSIATGNAGDGGAGTEGEAGQSGGTFGNGTPPGCSGGNGGTGADGAAGGGGAGGISVGILSTEDSTVTTSSNTMFEIGMAGAAGPAAMGSTNAGIPGVAEEALEVD